MILVIRELVTVGMVERQIEICVVGRLERRRKEILYGCR